MVNEADVTTLFVEERYWPIYESVKDSLSGVRNVIGTNFSPPGQQGFAELSASGDDIPVFADIDDSDTTLLIYTSGTTSLPKGVVLSYQALTALMGLTGRRELMGRRASTVLTGRRAWMGRRGLMGEREGV